MTNKKKHAAQEAKPQASGRRLADQDVKSVAGGVTTSDITVTKRQDKSS